MTLRQVHIALRRIDVRRHNNYAMQAALHDKKIDLKEVKIKGDSNTNFTEEESKAADAAMRRAMQSSMHESKKRAIIDKLRG